ncbi:MAG: peptidase S1, partial [Pseudanabaena sp. ELA748]
MRKGLVKLLASSLMLWGALSPIAIPLILPPLVKAQDEDTNISVYKLASPAVVSIQSQSGNGSG